MDQQRQPSTVIPIRGNLAVVASTPAPVERRQGSRTGHLPVCAETVDLLLQLLEGAQAGQVTGIAVVCTTPARNPDEPPRYITETSGYCHQNPTYALGALDVFKGRLKKVIEERREQTTGFDGHG